MDNPKVTIALVTYNRPHYLRKAIEGVLNQTFTDYELLVCDNGSTDNTEEIVSSFTDKRIKHVKNQVNNRNFTNSIFFISKGEYLIITHDDDIMLPDCISKELEVLEREPEVVVVACNAQFINEEGNYIESRFYLFAEDKYIEQYENLPFYLDFLLNKGPWLNPGCPVAMLRKSFFIENNLFYDFSVGPAVDAFLWYKISYFPVKIKLLSDVQYLYRRHNGQDSIINFNSLTSQLILAFINDLKNRYDLKNIEYLRKRLMRIYLVDSYKKYRHKEIVLKEYKRRLSMINFKGYENKQIRLEYWLFYFFPKLIMFFSITFRRGYNISRTYLNNAIMNY